jgi:hypothetical protein
MKLVKLATWQWNVQLRSSSHAATKSRAELLHEIPPQPQPAFLVPFLELQHSCCSSLTAASLSSNCALRVHSLPTRSCRSPRRASCLAVLAGWGAGALLWQHTPVLGHPVPEQARDHPGPLKGFRLFNLSARPLMHRSSKHCAACSLQLCSAGCRTCGGSGAINDSKHKVPTAKIIIINDSKRKVPTAKITTAKIIIFLAFGTLHLECTPM